jgi:hypothetical protein
MAKRLTPVLKDKLHRFHNMGPKELIDELGTLRAREKALKDEEDLVKTVLTSKLESEPETVDFSKVALAGTRYTLQVIKTIRATFSGEKAKQFLTDEQIEACTVKTEVTQYRTTLIDAAQQTTHSAEVA